VAILFPSTFTRLEIDEGNMSPFHWLERKGPVHSYRHPIKVERNTLHFFSLSPDAGFKLSETERAKEVVCLCQMVKRGCQRGTAQRFIPESPKRPAVREPLPIREAGRRFYLQRTR